MGYYCTVPQCTSMAGKTKNVKFHRFPRNIHLADKWNDVLKRGKPYTKYSKVCSLHFREDDYSMTTAGKNKGNWKSLNKNAIPSQKLPQCNADGSLVIIRKARTLKEKLVHSNEKQEAKEDSQVKDNSIEHAEQSSSWYGTDKPGVVPPHIVNNLSIDIPCNSPGPSSLQEVSDPYTFRPSPSRAVAIQDSTRMPRYIPQVVSPQQAVGLRSLLTSPHAMERSTHALQEQKQDFDDIENSPNPSSVHNSYRCLEEYEVKTEVADRSKDRYIRGLEESVVRHLQENMYGNQQRMQQQAEQLDTLMQQQMCHQMSSESADQQIQEHIEHMEQRYEHRDASSVPSEPMPDDHDYYSDFPQKIKDEPNAGLLSPDANTLDYSNESHNHSVSDEGSLQMEDVNFYTDARVKEEPVNEMNNSQTPHISYPYYNNENMDAVAPIFPPYVSQEGQPLTAIQYPVPQLLNLPNYQDSQIIAQTHVNLLGPEQLISKQNALAGLCKTNMYWSSSFKRPFIYGDSSQSNIFSYNKYEDIVRSLNQ